MPLFIHEDSKKLNKKQITLPDDVADNLKANANLYKNDSASKGYKRLMALTDKDYNKRSKKKDTQHNDKTTVSFGDARRIVSDLENMPQTKNNKEFNMVGGYETLYALKNGLKQARNSVKQVMPVPPVQKLDKRPDKVTDVGKPVQMGDVSVTVNESYIDNEFDFYEDYYYEYGAEYVLRNFFKNRKQPQNWLPLISPTQYKAALTEFTRLGYIDKFPSRKIYQWMGIIMKNTCILNANTDLIGHSNYSVDLYALEDILYENIPNFVGVESDSILVKLTEKEFYNMCSSINLTESNGVHRDGQIDLFMNQQEVDAHDKMAAADKYAGLIQKYNEYQKKHYSDTSVYFDEENEYLIHKIWYLEFFDELGLYDTMVLPDGGDAYSDYGLDPLFKIISEYNGNNTPEETLVIVNKALDVYHQRSDLAAAFIEGGSKSLSMVSEAIKKVKGKKTIYLNERQIKLLKEYHGDLNIPFNHPDQPYDPKLNYEHFIDFLEDIGKYGTLEPSGMDEYEINRMIAHDSRNVTVKECDSFADLSEYNELEYAFSEFVDEYGINEEMFYKNGDKIVRDVSWCNRYDELDILGIYYSFTEDNEKLFDNIFSDILSKKISSNINLTVDKRGLIYVERMISMPNALLNNIESQNYEDYYRLLSDTYNSIGECWSFDKGSAEAYCANYYGKDNTYITLKGYVSPTSVNWMGTYSLNFVNPEEFELRLNNDCIVEIDEITTTINGKGVKLPLKGPILVHA